MSSPHKALKKRVLTHLAQQPDHSRSVKEIAKHLRMKSGDEFQALRGLLEELGGEGVLIHDGRGRYRFAGRRGTPPPKKERGNRLEGVLRMNRRGGGFVRIDGSDEEFFIPPRFMKTALHGDRVAIVPFAQPIRRSGRGDTERPEAEIVEILQRAITTVVGELSSSRNFWFVAPDDSRIRRDIYVPSDEARKIGPGKKVVVRLLPWEDEHLNPEGEIIEVLGTAGDARVEVLSVARSFGLPMEFPPEVEREAEALNAKPDEEEISSRLDLRKHLCITIDPEDAKDFDDAVSFETLDNGLVRLGVHIADVSHYVREGSALDGEAIQRGTSVYLVNEVIPMLPERLSNDLCSLRPNVDRLTYSIIMDLDAQGNVKRYDIKKSVIHSARRFTYEEVQEIIESKRGEHADMILPLHTLTQQLLKKRRKNGSIDFDTPEAKFRFDTEGFPAAIEAKIRLDAHRLVEECMLLANKTVAEHVGRVRRVEHGNPFIYRVHDVPDPGKLEDLANFVKRFGFSFNPRQGVTPAALQRLLDQARGSEVEYLINEVALRSMAKAVYSEKNIGHFGLGFKHYTHFTSPIRRYPDLVVHRILKEYETGVSIKRRAELAGRLPFICRQSSDRERLAVEAERDSVKVMQVEYMKRHVGDELEGIIGGVTNFGLFVEINNLLVEGLVSVRDLADDYYLFDEKQYALRGRSRGRSYRLGDKVRVKVVSVNTEERQIDFAIVP